MKMKHHAVHLTREGPKIPMKSSKSRRKAGKVANKQILTGADDLQNVKPSEEIFQLVFQ
jgi:hypothetical protein